MPISNSLGIFKDKIEDAVSMVPDMTAEEKLRAVQFWNVVSERLQEIVNNSAADITALAFQLERDKFPEYLDGPLTEFGVSPGIVSGFAGCGVIANHLLTGSSGAFVSSAFMKKYADGEPRAALLPASMLGIHRSRTGGCHTSCRAPGPLSNAHASAILVSTPTRCSSPSSIDAPISMSVGLLVKGISDNENRAGNASGINPVVNVPIDEGKQCSGEDSIKEKSCQQLLNHIADSANAALIQQVEEEPGDPNGSTIHVMISADPAESASNNLCDSNSSKSLVTNSEVLSDKNVAYEECHRNSDPVVQPSDDNVEALGKSDNKLYKCHDCDASFSSKGNLIVHIRRHTGEKPYDCSLCKSSFSTKGNLKRHQKAHLGFKPWECPTCGGHFTEKRSLKVHMRRHTGEKPYQCKICAKKFSQTGTLQSHMAMHLNQKAHICELCGKSFRQKSQLRLHTQRHQGLRRFDCSHCAAKFVTKGDMLRHKRTHTGERPFECPLCGKTFTRQQSLNEHKNRHYGHKPYKCKYCSKGFAEMSACYKHIKNHEKSSSSGSNKTVEQADDDDDDDSDDPPSGNETTEMENGNGKGEGIGVQNLENGPSVSENKSPSKEKCATK